MLNFLCKDLSIVFKSDLILFVDAKQIRNISDINEGLFLIFQADQLGKIWI